MAEFQRQVQRLILRASPPKHGSIRENFEWSDPDFLSSEWDASMVIIDEALCPVSLLAV